MAAPGTASRRTLPSSPAPSWWVAGVQAVQYAALNYVGGWVAGVQAVQYAALNYAGGWVGGAQPVQYAALIYAWQHQDQLLLASTGNTCPPLTHSLRPLPPVRCR